LVSFSERVAYVLARAFYAPNKENDTMLFDPRLFNAIWLAIACTAITVGLAIVASLIVSTLTAIQVLRGKAERRPMVVEAYLQRHTSSRAGVDIHISPDIGWPK